MDLSGNGHAVFVACNDFCPPTGHNVAGRSLSAEETPLLWGS
jgi:hypothetical protein